MPTQVKGETMEAGRELDAQIARMLGWTDVDPEEDEDLVGWGVAPGEQWVSRIASPFQEYPHYSTDIGAALQVAEMISDRPQWAFDMYRGEGVKTYQAAFTAWDGSTVRRVYSAGASTAAHAICLAALEAIKQ